ncbi:MAG: KpsF/GutQ family sugar-phosphate isomerase [Phaeodactylibacter sp.]|nr:KpsF/GutQ family sugar-phosphate isomerase [Phaeodactylibacter sp.]MCB9295114.1 KpsF/GutQ family sugar-phosphate isomerase [Lewinellaceae bacterium]
MISEALITKTALRTIEIEAQTLKALKPSINASFVDCVQAIYECSGRLVVTGVGKSALVGQKIVATLNSTGTPSLFMHAADAIHGDLGMIQGHDFVLCISKSGETPEIKVLVPFLKNLGSPIIGMVSQLGSYLGQQARYVLHTPVPQEADPNNLAPTASTIAQAAMGDALATALLALRGFTPKDFAQFHPGGALGKQLYLRVYDLYPQNEKPAVQLDETIQRTILEMTSKRLGATAVLDGEGRLRGIITDGDLRRMLERGLDINTLCARDIMSPAPRVISDEEMAVKALQMMRRNSITQLIVTDKEGRYLGFVHLHDLIREGLI